MPVLNIFSSPAPSMIFTIDGIEYMTDYSKEFTEGSHVISFPPKYELPETPESPAGLYHFARWENGSTNPTRTINLTSFLNITAFYKLEPNPLLFLVGLFGIVAVVAVAAYYA